MAKGAGPLLFELGPHGADGEGRGRRAPVEAGADVTIKRVPELVPEAVAKAAYYKLDQEAEIATAGRSSTIMTRSSSEPSTRYGAMASQLKNFLGPDGSPCGRAAR
jgi:NAD(P)H dehydrogenase (quinone)